MPFFKEGDIVQLKGGGPLMTILRIMDDGITECRWLDEDGKEFKKVLQIFELKELGDDEKSV